MDFDVERQLFLVSDPKVNSTSGGFLGWISSGFFSVFTVAAAEEQVSISIQPQLEQMLNAHRSTLSDQSLSIEDSAWSIHADSISFAETGITARVTVGTNIEAHPSASTTLSL